VDLETRENHGASLRRICLLWRVGLMEQIPSVCFYIPSISSEGVGAAPSTTCGEIGAHPPFAAVASVMVPHIFRHMLQHRWITLDECGSSRDPFEDRPQGTVHPSGCMTVADRTHARTQARTHARARLRQRRTEPIRSDPIRSDPTRLLHFTSETLVTLLLLRRTQTLRTVSKFFDDRHHRGVFLGFLS
jgi:hypothetical protein